MPGGAISALIRRARTEVGKRRLGNRPMDGFSRERAEARERLLCDTVQLICHARTEGRVQSARVTPQACLWHDGGGSGAAQSEIGHFGRAILVAKGILNLLCVISSTLRLADT